MEKFLIIDGNSLINRAFYALPLLNNTSGEYSNAVYGFTNMLVKAIGEHKPKYIAVAFDYGKKTFRNQLFEAYKGTRKGMPEELALQMPILKKLLTTMNIKFVEKSGIEADDIIGSLSTINGVEKIILSGDRDVFQLISDDTNVWFTKKGISEVEVVDLKKLVEDYELSPSQVVENKALMGDSSDNIPGVSGVGSKTSLDLVKRFGNIENLYNNIESVTGKLKDKLIEGKDMAFLSKTLATIKRDEDFGLKIEDFEYTYPFSSEVFDMFQKYEFKSLLKREDIFQKEVAEEVKKNEIPYEVVKIKNIEILKQAISYVKEENKIAFDLTDKIQFASSQNFVYVLDDELSFFNILDGVDKDSIIKELKPIFESKIIDKVCVDVKQNLHVLDKYGITLCGDVFDCSVAKYLVYEGVKSKEQKIDVNLLFSEKKDLIEKLKQNDMEKLYYEMELPLIEVLFSMEKSGVKIDLAELKTEQERLNIELKDLTAKIFELAGEEFNINSPKQLGVILFDKLEIKNKGNNKKSTNVDILNGIENEHEIISYILRYRKIQKLQSTYIDSLKEYAEKNNGIIHTIFNQTQTSTGRLSSSEPNLQNIPVRDEEGKIVRKMFTSKFDDGYLISADYNQIELRLMAHFSQDKNLIDAFKKGLDIHKDTASKIFNIPLTDITAGQRRLAKAVNFGIIYGISDFGLAQNTGLTRRDAKEYIEKYFECYPKVKEYMAEAVTKVKSDGYVSTLFGRKRKINEINSDNANIRKFAERAAMNMPLQGTASDIIKLAMVRIYNRMKKENLQSQLVLQIHDELIVDTKNDERDKIIKILTEEMENVTHLAVELPASVGVGKNWLECK